MHEASLVQGLLEIIEKSVADYNQAHPGDRAAKVREIVCGAGLLACFEANTLRGCFEIFSAGGIAEGASLKINTMPLKCECENCGENFELSRRHFVCPHCGGEHINFHGGNGLTLLELNVEREDAEND